MKLFVVVAKVSVLAILFVPHLGYTEQMRQTPTNDFVPVLQHCFLILLYTYPLPVPRATGCKEDRRLPNQSIWVNGSLAL
jgi:hypothetical protein